MSRYQYPLHTGGPELAAELLGDMRPLWGLKTSDTSRASTTTCSDDPELFVSGLVANAIYEIEFFIMFSGDNSGNLKTNWTLPTGATGTRLCGGPASTASDAAANNINVRWGVHNVNTDIIYSCTRDSVTLFVWAWERGIIRMGNTAGTVALSWAQGSSFATETIVQNDSWVVATRLA